MNRYKVTYDNGTSLLLYKNSPEEILSQNFISKVISIELYTNNSHKHYIEMIKKLSNFLGYDYKNREVYKCSYYKGDLIIKFTKDHLDNTYYDFAEYQEQVSGHLLRPVTFTLLTPKKVYELISINKPQYIVYSHRYYGQPKLNKPKELKNIKSIGNAVFIQNHCNPQIYIKENDIYIKHTDYFSSLWSPPVEEIGQPQNYYLNKYFNKNRNGKFVYTDCWGNIVLRNEAWILMKDYLPVVRTENSSVFAANVVSEQRKDKYSKSLRYSETENEWMRFYEDIYKVVREYIDKTNN